MNIALLSCGLLALLLISLSLLVSLSRRRLGQGYGPGADGGSWLSKVVRAQGNAAEYIPLFIVLMLLLDVEGGPNWADWVYMGAVASRYSHAAGILLSSDINRPHVLRVLGSLGTYGCGFALGILVVMAAI